MFYDKECLICSEVSTDFELKLSSVLHKIPRDFLLQWVIHWTVTVCGASHFMTHFVYCERNFASSFFLTYYHIIYIIYHITSYHTIPYHSISHISYHIMSRHVISYHIISCFITQVCTILQTLQYEEDTHTQHPAQKQWKINVIWQLTGRGM